MTRKISGHRSSLNTRHSNYRSIWTVVFNCSVKQAMTWIQWESEIWTSLDFIWSKKEFGLQMVWDLKSGSLNIWNLNKWQPFCQKPFEILTKISECQMVGFWMVGTIAVAKAKAQPFENQTFWNPILKKSGFQIFQISCGRISDSQCNRI